MDFDISDFSQCDKLVKSISGREFYRYKLRVMFPKLEYDDFYQNGWVALQDCINKEIKSLDYICVAIRHSIYRGIEKSSVIQTTNKKELWYYISGHESRMEDPVGENSNLQDYIEDSLNYEDNIVNSVLVGQIFENISKEDKIEVLRIMNNLPPLRRKVRQNCKRRIREKLGIEDYIKKQPAKYQSVIKCVNYDKTKDKWSFKKKINGKYKVLYRNNDQHLVEEWAVNYYKSEGVDSGEYIKKII